MSAYRSRVPAPRATHTVLCRACGEAVPTSDEHDVTCGACQLAQPALRDDWPWSITSIDVVKHVPARHSELDAFSDSIGAPEGALLLLLDCDGIKINVSLHLNSGTVTGLDFDARTNGLPGILLRREEDTDAAAKESGIAREVQTGDEAFDRAVYIASEASDADVLRVLSSPAVRRAVRRLLEEFKTVRIDGDGVTLNDSDAPPKYFAPEFVNEMLAALRVVAGAPRPLVPSRSKVPGTPLASFVLAPLGFGAMMWADHVFPSFDTNTLGPIGAIGGLLAAMAVQPLVTRVFSGRSTSHVYMNTARLTVIIGLPMLVVGLLYFVNGALDRSAEVEHHFTASAVVEIDTDDSRYTRIHAGDKEHALVLKTSKRPHGVKEGDPVTMWSRSGALGTRWRSRPSEVKTASGMLTVQ